MAKGFHKELSQYLSKRPKQTYEFVKTKPSDKNIDDFDEFAGVSDTQMTILRKEKTVFDTLKKSVKKAFNKLQPHPSEEAPRFDEQGNILNKDEYEKNIAQSQNVLQKGGKIVTNIFSKLDVFDIIGKKSTATAQAEYAELKEFEEVIQSGQDVKELARISANILRLLPSEKLDEFKKGSDFKAYKDILKKNGIIK